MIGTIRWNLVIGVISGLLSFILAEMNNNLLLTALTRGFISFVVMFLLTFLFRWLLALIVLDGGVQAASDKPVEEAPVGKNIDYTTPEQDIELPEVSGNDSRKSAEETPPTEQRQQQFQSFEPPRVVVDKQSGKEDQPDPDTIVKAVRRLTED